MQGRVCSGKGKEVAMGVAGFEGGGGEISTSIFVRHPRGKKRPATCKNPPVEQPHPPLCVGKKGSKKKKRLHQPVQHSQSPKKENKWRPPKGGGGGGRQRVVSPERKTAKDILGEWFCPVHSWGGWGKGRKKKN